MTRIISLLPLSLLLLTGFSLASAAPEPKGPAGDWSGTLQVGQVKLRLLFKIKKTPEGSLTGTLDSLDQGAKDLPVDKVEFKENKLRMEVKLIEGVFEGTLDSAASKINGSWNQDGQSLPLTLARGAAGVSVNEALSPADAAASRKAAEKLGGEWSGMLKAEGNEFRLVLNIKTNSDGTAAATLDSLAQNLHGAPLSPISYKDGKVHFEARGLTASYDGVSFNNSTTVTGQWHQAGQTLPLNFNKTAPKTPTQTQK